MIQYQEKPFYLNDEDIHWVEHTLASMTLEEKIGQLFCVTDMITDPEALKAFVQKYHIGGFQTGGFGESDNIAIPLKEALERAGFTVSLYDYATMERGEIFTAGVQDMQKKFDLSIVAANVSTGSNYTSRRLDRIALMAANEPWYMRDIPTLFLSFCNPYHMVDVPFISTFVNCYSASRFCVESVVEKLTGSDAFRGNSPVDPWCNAWGAKFM